MIFLTLESSLITFIAAKSFPPRKRWYRFWRNNHLYHGSTAFLVPVLLITLINTPKLNKTVSQIRGTQDGRFHLHQLCWAGERGKNLLVKICHLVSKWHYGSCFCSLGAFIGHWGWMMVIKMKIYAIIDLPVFFSDFLSTFCIFKALLKYSATL